MTYDRARIMKTAHAEWRATKHRPGMTFARCLKLAWAVERRRLAPREYYQPPIPAMVIPMGNIARRNGEQYVFRY